MKTPRPPGEPHSCGSVPATQTGSSVGGAGVGGGVGGRKHHVHDLMDGWMDFLLCFTTVTQILVDLVPSTVVID